MWKRRLGVAVIGIGVLALAAGTAWAIFVPTGQLWGMRLQTVVPELRVSTVADTPPLDSFSVSAQLTLNAELLPGAPALSVPFWVRNVSSHSTGFSIQGSLIPGTADWAVIAPHIQLRVSSSFGSTPWLSLADWGGTSHLHALPGQALLAGEQRRYTLEFQLPASSYTTAVQGKSTGQFGFQVSGNPAE